MNKISKKDIRKSIEDAVGKVLLRFKATETGKKGKKLLDSFSRKYAAEVKKAIKRLAKESITKSTTKNVTVARKIQRPKRKTPKKQIRKNQINK